LGAEGVLSLPKNQSNKGWLGLIQVFCEQLLATGGHEIKRQVQALSVGL
jgi:hypothetical protein